MSNNNPIPLHQSAPTVQVDGNEVRFDGFVDRDPDVIDVLSDAEDTDRAAHTCLQIGARALKVANASSDAMVVERAFDGLSVQFDTTLQSALADMTKVTDKLFADDGSVSEALTGWKEQVTTLLGDTFDPDSKSSVIAKLEGVLDQVGHAHRKAIRDLIDPTRDDSPLMAWRSEIVKEVRERSEAVGRQVQELSEKIAVAEKGAEMFELTTLKGVAFEDLVHEAICPLASLYGDTAAQTGAVEGLAGTKKGDEVVTLNLEDTAGAAGCFVLEMKDRKLTHPKTVAALDEAMDNRGAQVGIAVFAKQDLAPTSVPFSYSGNHAVLVFDKAAPDPHLLRLAYLWARWTVRKALNASSNDEVDRDRVRALIERVVTAMKVAASIKGAHTSAKKEIDKAGSHLDALHEEVNTTLEDLRLVIGA